MRRRHALLGRSFRRALAVVAALSVWPFMGCRWAETLAVQIPDFDSSAVQGLWVWRQANPASAFERSSRYRIEKSVVHDGEEYVLYTIFDADGDARWTLPAAVVRDAQNPDNVRLQFLLLLQNGGGDFKASTYNAAGESGLSAQSIHLAGL